MKIAADTNVLVRAVVRDDKMQAEVAARVLRNASLVAVAVSGLCEFVWVLRRKYGLPAAEVAAAIRVLLAAGNVEVDRPAVAVGLTMLDAGGFCRWRDCLRGQMAGRGDVCFVRQESGGNARGAGGIGAVAITLYSRKRPHR